MEKRIEYKMIDLCLPSGLKWGDRNVGAATPEAYGDYFMWGSVTPDTGKICDWSHAPFNNGSEKFDESYFNEHKSEWLTGNGTLKPEYDAAHAAMGGSCRMPTSEEMQELLDGTTQSVEELNGVKGMRFTSKTNGNSIFMPFGGDRYGSYFGSVDYYGLTWSSSINAGYASSSHSISFRNGGRTVVDLSIRCGGFVVRGVCE